MVCEFCVLFAQESRMNNLLITITLLCFSIGAAAQEKEIWACQQEAGTQLIWEDGRWKSFGVTDTQLLLTLNGANSAYKIGSIMIGLSCSEAFGNISCFSTYTGDRHIYFDPDSGRMGLSSLYGAVIKADTESVYTQIFNCTKF